MGGCISKNQKTPQSQSKRNSPKQAKKEESHNSLTDIQKKENGNHLKKSFQPKKLGAPYRR